MRGVVRTSPALAPVTTTPQAMDYWQPSASRRLSLGLFKRDRISSGVTRIAFQHDDVLRRAHRIEDPRAVALLAIRGFD